MNQHKELIEFLKEHGASEIEHVVESFLGHLISTYDILKKWGCKEDVCVGGLLHSIYGTEGFIGLLPIGYRDVVREMAGEYAEYLAFLNCCLDRDSLDLNLNKEDSYWIRNRFCDTTINISKEELLDIYYIQVADLYSKNKTSKQLQEYKRPYIKMAEVLGGEAYNEFLKSYNG